MDRRFIIGPLIFLLFVVLAVAIWFRSAGNGGSILRGLPNVAGMATATPVGATSQNAANPNAPLQPIAPATPAPPPATPTTAIVNITPVPVNEVTAIPAPTIDPGTMPPDAGSGDSGGADPGDAGLPCNTRVTHIVRAGENLFRIALRYRTTAAAVARLNGITNVRRVSVGQRLRIITCGRGYSSSGSIGRGATYTVQPGDTIFRIALRYGVNVQYLCRVNGLYSNLIVPGQTLIIP